MSTVELASLLQSTNLLGYTGSQGQDGSAGIVSSNTAPENTSLLWYDIQGQGQSGYTGSQGVDGYTGSQGPIGYSGSQGIAGYSGSAGSGASINIYTTLTLLPSTGNTEGTMAFVQDTKTLYIWDGTEWDRVYHGIDESPLWITEPSPIYYMSLNTGPSNITVQATDPEGFPIIYSHDTNPTNQTQVVITNSGGIFTLNPNANATASNVTIRFKASDGIHISARSSLFRFSIGAITGIKVNQTSYDYGHTVWRLIALGITVNSNNTSINIFDDSGIRSETVVDASSWGTILPISTSHTTGYFSTYFINKSQSYGVALPNPYYVVGVDESAANVSRSVRWNTPLQVTQILISGDMTNNYNYFNGGNFQLYINGVLDPTTYTFISDGNNNFYYSFQ